MQIPRKPTIAFVFVATAWVSSLGFAAELTVSGTDTIFGAGFGTPPSDGTFPPSYSFTPAPGQVLSFSSVQGSVSSGPYSFGPDGEGATIFCTSMDNYFGLSGIQADVSFFLMGVFLDNNMPNGKAPAILNFGAAGLGPDFPALSPEIGQTFYIGDGRVGHGGVGAVQSFNVPPTASRLFLGIADGQFNGSCVYGTPTNYYDNGGAFTGNFVIVSEFPTIVAIGQETHNIRLTWITPANKTNFVQATSVIPSAGLSNSFADISPPIFVAGTGNVTTNYLDVSVTTNTASRYYRIRVVP